MRHRCECIIFFKFKINIKKKIILSETSLFSLSFKCFFFIKGFLFENIIVIYKKRPDALIWSSCAMKLKIVELWCKTKLGNVFKFALCMNNLWWFVSYFIFITVRIIRCSSLQHRTLAYTGWQAYNVHLYMFL